MTSSNILRDQHAGLRCAVQTRIYCVVVDCNGVERAKIISIGSILMGNGWPAGCDAARSPSPRPARDEEPPPKFASVCEATVREQPPAIPIVCDDPPERGYVELMHVFKLNEQG